MSSQVGLREDLEMIRPQELSLGVEGPASEVVPKSATESTLMIWLGRRSQNLPSMCSPLLRRFRYLAGVTIVDRTRSWKVFNAAINVVVNEERSICSRLPRARYQRVQLMHGILKIFGGLVVKRDNAVLACVEMRNALHTAPRFPETFSSTSTLAFYFYLQSCKATSCGAFLSSFSGGKAHRMLLS